MIFDELQYTFPLYSHADYRDEIIPLIARYSRSFILLAHYHP